LAKKKKSDGDTSSVKEELHPTAKRRHWIVQRVGWAGMAFAIVLAVAGVFGGGLLSEGSRSASAGGLDIELSYPRFTRMTVPEHLEVAVTAPEAGGELSVMLSERFITNVSIQSISPEPDSTSVGPSGHTYTWRVDDWSGEITVVFEYRADSWRRIHGDVEVTAGGTQESLSFWQFVFP
jgi:hypothetical protein